MSPHQVKSHSSGAGTWYFKHLLSHDYGNFSLHEKHLDFLTITLLRRRRNLRRVPTTEEKPEVPFSRVLKGLIPSVISFFDQKSYFPLYCAKELWCGTTFLATTVLSVLGSLFWRGCSTFGHQIGSEMDFPVDFASIYVVFVFSGDKIGAKICIF